MNIRKLGNLNKRVQGRTNKEYREHNKEKKIKKIKSTEKITQKL